MTARLQAQRRALTALVRLPAILARLTSDQEAQARLFQSAEVWLYEAGLAAEWALTADGELVPRIDLEVSV